MQLVRGAAAKRRVDTEATIDDAQRGALRRREGAGRPTEEPAKELRVRAVVDEARWKAAHLGLAGDDVAVVVGPGEEQMRAGVAAVIPEHLTVFTFEDRVDRRVIGDAPVSARPELRIDRRDEHEAIFEVAKSHPPEDSEREGRGAQVEDRVVLQREDGKEQLQTGP